MERTCPICHKAVKTSDREESDRGRFLPFCSERCKLVDLGAWLDAEYKIVPTPDELESGESPEGDNIPDENL